MRQIINYMKLSYKQLLWVMFLMLFFLQFRVYYEEGKFIYEVMDEKDGYIDLYFLMNFILWPRLLNYNKTKEKVKLTKGENLGFFLIMIYALLIFMLNKFGVSMGGVFNTIQLFFIIFFGLFYVSGKITKEVKLLPINNKKKAVAMSVLSLFVISISYLSVESVVYVDKLLNSSDLARFYSGSIKGLFIVVSLLCYRKFNLKKKREEDVTESFVYKTLKGWK